MKLLLTIQPKNATKPSDPMIIDPKVTDLCCLANDFLDNGDCVLIIQRASEYTASGCENCASKL